MTEPDWDAHIRACEEAPDRLDDKRLGRLICGLRGWHFKRVIVSPDGSQMYLHHHVVPDPGPIPTEPVPVSSDEPITSTKVWTIPRRFCPDVDLTAADALVREVLPGWGRYTSVREKIQGGIQFYCDLTAPNGKRKYIADAYGNTLPIAILTALCRAKKAEAET